MKRPSRLAGESSAMRAAAVLKRASKPFWMALYAMAVPRFILSLPKRPVRIELQPRGHELGLEAGAEQGTAHD